MASPGVFSPLRKKRRRLLDNVKPSSSFNLIMKNSFEELYTDDNMESVEPASRHSVVTPNKIMDKYKLPVSVKNTAVGRNSDFYVAATSMQGWGHSMEDAYAVHLQISQDKEWSYFATFDGHHGSEISEYASHHLHHHIFSQRAYHDGNIQQALEEGFLELDTTMRDNPALVTSYAGSTAVVVLIKGSDIFCANVGNSSAVAYIRRDVYNLSTDHLPTLPREKMRIRRAGGFLLNNKVNGELNLTRTLGDYKYKLNGRLPLSQQAVTSFPDVRHLKLTKDWAYILLGSDGIVNSYNNKSLCSAIDERIQFNYKPEDIIEELLDICLASHGIGAKDNMTIILIVLLKNTSEEYINVLTNEKSGNKRLQSADPAIRPSTSGLQTNSRK